MTFEERRKRADTIAKKKDEATYRSRVADFKKVRPQQTSHSPSTPARSPVLKTPLMRYMSGARPGNPSLLKDYRSSRVAADTSPEIIKFSGNIDLTKKHPVRNHDGSYSTIRSMSFGNETGQQILVPTVINKDGKLQVVSDDEAIENYYKTGEYLGKYSSIAEAENAAQLLHDSEAKKLEKYYSYTLGNNKPVYKTQPKPFAPKNTNDVGIIRTPYNNTAEKIAYDIGKGMGSKRPNTILGGLQYNLARGAQGAAGAVEGITDFAVGNLDTGLSWLTSLGGTKPNAVSEWWKKGAQNVYDTKVSQAMEKGINDEVKTYIPKWTKVGGDIYNVAGNMMTSIGAGKAASGATKIASDVAGKLAIGANAGGNSAQQAYSEGTPVEKAAAFGNAAGTLEAAIESISGGIPGLGKGVIDKAISKFVKYPKALQAVTDIVGEGGEEVLSDIITPYLQRAIYNPEAEDATLEEMAKDFAMGAGLSGLMQGAQGIGNINLGKGKAQNVVDSTADATAQAQDVAPQPAQPPVAPPTMDSGINTLPIQDIAQSPVSTTTNTQDIATQPIQSSTIAQDVPKANLPAETQSTVQGVTEPKNHIDNRTPESVGKRSIKAFQYDHPELHGYFETMAQALANEVESQTMQDFMRPSAKRGSATAERVGTRYDAKGPVKELMDMGLSKPQILQCCEDIINDRGSENYAAAKRVELVLDNMLTNGYVAYNGVYSPTIFDYVEAKQQIVGAKTQAQRDAEVNEWLAAVEGLPQGTGAKSADFSYDETLTQTHSTDNVITDAERQIEGLRPEDRVHKVNHDIEVDAKAKERFDFDYEGEKADLFSNSKTDVDDVDTRLQEMILGNELAKARQTGDYSEVIKLHKAWDKQGTKEGQAFRERQRFSNTPAGIVSEAADTLANIEYQNKPVSERTKKATPAETRKAAKAVEDAVEGAAKELKQNYSNGKGSKRRKTAIEGNQVGEPFVFEYEEKVGEAVAKAIENKVKPKKSAETTFLKEISNQIKAFANEKFQSPKSSKSLTAIERLTDYINNHEFYNGAWEEAQQYLRNKYAGDVETLSKLDSFINSGIGVDGNINPQNKIFVRALVTSAIESGETKTTISKQNALGFTGMWKNISNEIILKTGATGEYANTIRSAAQSYVADVIGSSDIDVEKTVNTQIKSAMHDIGETINKVVTKSAKEKQSVKSAVESMLFSKYGFGDVDAQNVAEVVGNHFDALVEDNAQKRLETMFGKERVAPNMKSFLQRFSELRNLGAFENSKYAQAAADKLFGNFDEGTTVTTEKFQNILSQISEAADTLDNIQQGDTASVIELIKQINEVRGTTGLLTKKTSGRMSKWLDTVADFDDGFEFLSDVASQQIRNVANDYQKASPLEAVKSLRIQNMLSKATTILRNLVGNNVFDPVDSMSNNMAVPLDVLLSKITGTRSISVDKSWLSKSKRRGSIEGFVKSAIQVGLDADITGAQSKYETRSGRTFKMTGNPVERLLSTWAKWENYALQSTDEFQKGGISAETQRGIDKLKSKGLIADDALADRAGEVAKQRTFQNDGMLATTTVKLRDAANVLGVHDKQGGSFGLGDLALPFAKVPANIVAQGGNYSPAGLVKGSWNLAKTLKQAHNGTLTAEQQAKAVTDIGRGLNGTAGIAMFTALAIKGIIRVAGSDDRDKEALETSEGQRGTQFNMSAFERWLKGKSTEWQDSDTLMSIGFLEPINAQMAAGAMIAEAYQDDKTLNAADVADATVTSVFQSVLDLPAMSQISDLINGYKYSSAEKTSGKLADAATNYGASQAASFVVPNLVAGIAQGADNTVRDVFVKDNPLLQAKNNVISKIPFARNTLPVKLDSYGDERKYTENPLLNALNANVLPGQLGTYKTNAVNQELFRLDKAGVDVKYPSRKAPNDIKYDNESLPLSAEDKEKFQKTIGGKTYDLISETLKDSGYKKLNDEKKAKLIKNLMGYANDTAKREYIGGKYKSNSYEKTFEAEKQGISPTNFFVYKTAVSDIDDNDSVTQAEAAQALENTDITTRYKGKLWQLQNADWKPEKNPYTGTLAQAGFAPKAIIRIMNKRAELEDEYEDYERDEAKQLPSREALKTSIFKTWLQQEGYMPDTVSFILDEYKFWNHVPAKTTKQSESYLTYYPYLAN